MLDFDKIKYFFVMGLWTEKQVMDAVKVGIITEEQYEKIIKMRKEIMLGG